MAKNLPIENFKAKIQAVLQGSIQWVSWQRALEATFREEYIDDVDSNSTHTVYCVDNHLLIEFLLPRPLKFLSPDGLPSSTSLALESYPRPLDLALFLMFGAQEPINILPPHHQEFFYKVQDWQRQLLAQNEKLSLFQSALDRMITVVEQGDDGTARDRFRHFLDAVLSEEGSFAGILALETQGVRSIASIKRRLRVVARESLVNLVRDWKSSEARDRIDTFFNALSVLTRGRATPSNTRVDAHALYLLEKENGKLPENTYLVLLAQSAKIWSLVSNTEQCAAIEFQNQRDNIWLIQPPEVMLVSAMAKKMRSEGEGEGEAGERDARRLLILDLEQNKRLRVIRDEVEHEILPRLDLLAHDPIKWEECQLRVEELEKGLRKLKSVAQDRDRLLTLRLGLDAPENWGGSLFQKLRSLRDVPQAELRSTLSWELERLRIRMRDLEEQLLVATPLSPDDDNVVDVLGGLSPELQGVARNQAEGTTYFICFQSASIISHLRKIEELLRDIDAEDISDRDTSFIQLHSAMRDAKRSCHEEPEYHLMLTVIYASRGLWFEAYVAANQGLKRLQKAVSLSSPSFVNIAIEQVESESQLLKGAALQHWALARYSDLPQFVGQFLEEAAECVRKSLTISGFRDVSGLLGTRRDPRALRELAAIYGNAREVEEFSHRAGRLKPGQRLVTPVKEDLEFAGLPPNEPFNLLSLYRALAEKAYEGWPHAPSMHACFVNTLLFALVEEDDGIDSDRKTKLVGELDKLIAKEAPINYLDTLAWFYFRRARYIAKLNGDPSADIMHARGYIARAREKLKTSRRRQKFFDHLMRAREEDLDSL